MSAVTVQAPLPMYQEAMAFWDELTLQCKRHVKAINAVILDNNIPESEGIRWEPGSLRAAMVRPASPSTEVNLNLQFEHWGARISGSVEGRQQEDLRFYPEEFEFAICCDEDERPVAISAEGRSLTPHELAKYLAQNFRRCFPGVSLPCPNCPLE